MATNIPTNLKYTNEHEWVLVEGDIATFGITDYAQSALGDIVFVEMPESGSEVEKGNACGVVESIKSVSDIYSPVSGEVVETNADLEDTPDLCNQSAYDQAWMVKVRMSNPSELDELMTPAQYKELCDSSH